MNVMRNAADVDERTNRVDLAEQPHRSMARGSERVPASGITANVSAK